MARCAESPLGWLPQHSDIDIAGPSVDTADLAELLSVDVGAWAREVPLLRMHYARSGDRLPNELLAHLNTLESRLGA